MKYAYELFSGKMGDAKADLQIDLNNKLVTGIVVVNQAVSPPIRFETPVNGVPFLFLDKVVGFYIRAEQTVPGAPAFMAIVHVPRIGEPGTGWFDFQYAKTVYESTEVPAKLIPVREPAMA